MVMLFEMSLYIYILYFFLFLLFSFNLFSCIEQGPETLESEDHILEIRSLKQQQKSLIMFQNYTSPI